jgi:hypothetical protein
VDYSEDQGLTWKSWGWIYRSETDLSNPAIAVTNVYEDYLVVVYEVHESGVAPYIESARERLSIAQPSFSVFSIKHFSPEHELNPHLWCDLHSYPTAGILYLVYEWVQDQAANNVNVVFQRSGNGGQTWRDEEAIWGNADARDHRSPHGCWGEANNHYLYVVSYDRTNKTIDLRRSANWGVDFEDEKHLLTVAAEPTASSVAPVIAASTAPGVDGVWVSFAAAEGSDDDIQYLFSSDYGATFSGPGIHQGQTTAHESAPWVLADPLGKFIHVVWTVSNGTVWYDTVSGDGATWRYAPRQVNRGGTPSFTYPEKAIATDWRFGFAGIAWLDYGYSPISVYLPMFNRDVPDDLIGTWDGQGVYYRTDGGKWILLASPALQVAAGDLDGFGDGTADLIGDWSGQGLCALSSVTKDWTLIGLSPVDIAVGNIDADPQDEIIGTWDGQGVFYKTSVSGGWVQAATPATMIAAGDLDGDGLDDLIGVWPSQAGVWVKYSQSGTWDFLGSAPGHIAAGDMDGDGRDDLLGTWDGQGVFWRKSQTGVWTQLGSPATMITAADMDGDGKDDVVGIWPTQAGVWTKYSSTDQWEYLGSALRDLAGGKMRAGSNTWGAQSGWAGLFEPAGGIVDQLFPVPKRDYSASSPGRPGFTFRTEPNLVPVQDPLIPAIPGPGMAGFRFDRTPNLLPLLPVKSGDRDPVRSVAK